MGPNLGGCSFAPPPHFFEFWARGHCPSTDHKQTLTTGNVQSEYVAAGEGVQTKLLSEHYHFKYL